MNATTNPDKRIEAIAQAVLNIPTLERRWSDELDFHDVAVWQVEKALRQACAAGYQAALHDVGAVVVDCRAYARHEEERALACAERIGGEVMSLPDHLVVVRGEDVERIDQAGGPSRARLIEPRRLAVVP